MKLDETVIHSSLKGILLRDHPYSICMCPVPLQEIWIHYMSHPGCAVATTLLGVWLEMEGLKPEAGVRRILLTPVAVITPKEEQEQGLRCWSRAQGWVQDGSIPCVCISLTITALY